MKGVIVIIGYNRPDSIRRCYESVVKAMYPENEEIDLIFSLDHSGMEAEITDMISGFVWEHGEKKVITHEERMGLRKHVIS
ncbi:MAG: glycosyltransferase [Erysipelotrichaceae bacterium]|nr:glycosyltransferase [Erysipelotrichaceae bacterium]